MPRVTSMTSTRQRPPGTGLVPRRYAHARTHDAGAATTAHREPHQARDRTALSGADQDQAPCPVQLSGLVPFVSLCVPSGHVLFDQVVPVRSAPVKSAPVRSAPDRLACGRSAFVAVALISFALVKLVGFAHRRTLM